MDYAVTHLFATYLPYLLSAITVWQMFLAGKLHKSAWLVGLVNQFLWLAWIVASQTWGLIPLNLALWIVYFRNHSSWKSEPDWKTLYEQEKKWHDDLTDKFDDAAEKYLRQGRLDVAIMCDEQVENLKTQKLSYKRGSEEWQYRQNGISHLKKLASAIRRLP